MVTAAREIPQREAVSAATFSAACMIAQHVGGKAVRDALFLGSFGRGALAWVMLASAALSLVGVLVMSRVLARAGPARAVPLAFSASAALFAGEWALAGVLERAAAMALYFHLAVLGGVTISGFWSAINERFDPHEAKDAIRRITGGAAFGGAAGGLLAERSSALLGLRSTLLVLAAVNVLCALGLLRMGRPRAAAQLGGLEAPSGLQILRETPYLQHMGALVALTGAAAALSDYAFKAEAAAWLPGGAALVAFFAIFYGASDLLTLVLQASLSRPSLERLGLGGTMAILPGAVLATSVLGAAITRVWSVLLVRVAATSLSNAFFRSAYELLYTPLPPHKKRPTKTFVDVACDRLGDMCGSGLALLALALAPAAALSVVVACAGVASAAALWFCRRLHGEYVAALAEGLRSGAVQIAEEQVADATTRATLTTTTLAFSRDRLLAQIERLPGQRAEAGPSGAPAPQPAVWVARAEEDRAQAEEAASEPRSLGPRAAPLLAATADLLSGDRDRIASVLAAPLDPRLVAHVVPLLARGDVKEPALRALRGVAPLVIGQLADALLDPQVSAAVRARVPCVLEVCDAPRAVAALLDGLGDERFEVRGRCAEALGRVRRRRPDIALPRATILEAAERELRDGRAGSGREGAGPGGGRAGQAAGDGLFRAGLEPGEAHRVLEYVFDLLALVLDPEPMELALRALVTGDGPLRGTALEYLDNVLPEPIRGALQPYLAEERPRASPRRPRPPQALVEELRRSLG
ncbi:hypothetical protein WMF04_44430 [Sorangium sp. So ce260]|uniref:hypothetical protein n=1 Tax=Sorangium sp. So ce260 TaxID=3133291 RepID=UPI003F5F8F0B